MSSMSVSLESTTTLVGDFEQLGEALAGRWTFDKLIISMLAHKTAEDRKCLRQRYVETYGEDLLETFDSEANEGFELLVPLVSSSCYPRPEVDITLAEAEAVVLHQKISKKAYNDWSLIRISATRSKAQVNATLDHYKYAFGNEVNKDLKADPNDEFLPLLKATIKCLACPEKYFEKVLRVALTAERRDEEALVGVLSTRAEVEMKLVAKEYRRKNGAPLNSGYEILQALVARADA